jgi:hypothetical protein
MADGRKRKRDTDDVVGEIATEFRCSITTSLIVEPVTTMDGQLYEKSAIAEWLSTHDTSPNTGKRLVSKVLTPAPAIRSAIERIVRSDALAPEESRTWRTRKANVLIAEGNTDEAKVLLRDAKQAGDTTAAFLLGKLLIDEGRTLVNEAAAAGVAEAAEYLQVADGRAEASAATAHRPPLRSVSEVPIGHSVVVLPSAEALTRDHHYIFWSEEKAHFVGNICNVIQTDADDQTMLLRCGTRCSWFPVAVCASATDQTDYGAAASSAAAAAHGPPLSSVSEVRIGQYVIVLPSAEAMTRSELRHFGWDESSARCVGQKCKISLRDEDDQSLFVICVLANGDYRAWIPVGACAKPRS